MRISKIELEYSDIEWFGIDKNKKIIRFTSGLYGYVPEFVCISTENTDLLCEFFENLHNYTTAILLSDERFGIRFLDECRDISSKGIYCFDAFDGQHDTTSYTKISEPKQPLYLYELPAHIQNIIRTNIIDTDVDTTDTIKVHNAY